MCVSVSVGVQATQMWLRLKTIMVSGWRVERAGLDTAERSDEVVVAGLQHHNV